MEEESQASSVEVPVKVVDNVETHVDTIPVTVGGEDEIRANGDLHQIKKEGNKEEAATLYGEFIKVEKEALDVKDSSHTDKAAVDEEHQLTIEHSSSNSMGSKEVLEVEGKTKALELEIERMAREQQHSESEKTRLEEVVVVAKEKLEEREKLCGDLELAVKRLQEQIREAEAKYSAQLIVLQEALGAQGEKHKELTDVKEAFEGLTIELESSRKKMLELEQERETSAVEARKFQELCEQSGSNAESEAQKALEFERLLESAKVSAKEMEDQVASLQDELKGLHDKVAENQRVEEALRSTAAELSAVQSELELSKSKVMDLEQKLISGEAVTSELTKELNLCKAAEEQIREDISSLENLFSSAKEDLRVKIASLEETELKLQEEVKMRETAEISLRNQEEKISIVQAEFEKVNAEKEALDIVVADLNSNIMLTKVLCNDLEARLKLSDDNFQKSDELLLQALSHNAELEEKLRSLEELHQESGSVAATATQRNLELEDIIRSSTAAEEEAKLQLREVNMRLISAEQRSVELEQQVNMAELKSSVADKELKELSEKTAELTAMLKEFEKDSAQLKNQLHEYEERITILESALSQSSSRNSDLEKELRDVADKCTQHEDRANMTHQRSLELEDLIQLSHSKAEGAGKKVGEVELLLEAANYQIKELEEQASVLEAYQSKLSSLEAELQAANRKERELLESVNTLTEEKKLVEDTSKISNERLSEFGNLLEVLQSELRLAQEKLENTELNFEASAIRESEIMEKLKSAEEKLEQQGRLIEQATARNSELELLHESLSKDSELKLQEAKLSISQRDSEAKELNEKLKILEEQAKIYQDQAMEAAEKEALLKGKLEESSAKLVTLEKTIDELESKLLAVESKLGQSFSENELLAETNLKLKKEVGIHQIKVNELQELLSSIRAEKEATLGQLDSHMKTITELTEQHSRVSEIQSSSESCLREAEVQLHEAIERFAQKDSEAKDLNEKLNALEVQVRVYEERANEVSTTAERGKLELEEALLKASHLESMVDQLQSKAGQFETKSEGLAEANLKLTQELASHETKMNEMQMMLNKVLVEKEETVEQLQSSKKTVDDLKEQLASEGQRQQVQISSVMEENNVLAKTYQDAREEQQAVIAQMETQLNEGKARENALNAQVEKLKAGITEKSLMQTQVQELEQQLISAETRLKDEVENMKATVAEKEVGMTSKLEDYVKTRVILDEQVVKLQEELNLAYATIAEQKEADSRKELEREASLSHSLGELEAKHKQATLLEKKIEEFEQKLQLADAKYKEKEIEEERKHALVSAELDDLKKKLRQTVELEKKIVELENKLMLEKRKSEGNKGIQAELKDALEVKSRGLESIVSTPSKRKSKKRTEATAQATEGSSTTSTQTTDSSSSEINFRFILGVALVSIIIGVILGKRY